ncbi:hypothetical protein GTZ99_15995 [Novosphingobium sp. FSY-8]|uniref:DUF6456 domain-containing protein n=1 Tax=Novosphingobium ovatum TaxID=1908523 RepID=A0ABW9XHK9_9SPHN|nr:DUF6456 domain-containing protein [Novosphingobium ovatum]NBC38055.1 hypothetical protein [Novosphingobium ovatum]
MLRQFVEREISEEGPIREAVGATNRAARRTVMVNLGESPITWLHARGHISDRENDAGERLRADWEMAGLSPGMTMRWEPVVGRGGARHDGLNATERQIAAKSRFDGAIAHAGKGLSDILWRVVCAGEALQDAEKALAWPSRSGKLVLKLALDRVADFYRIN